MNDQLKYSLNWLLLPRNSYLIVKNYRFVSDNEHYAKETFSTNCINTKWLIAMHHIIIVSIKLIESADSSTNVCVVSVFTSNMFLHTNHIE